MCEHAHACVCVHVCVCVCVCMQVLTSTNAQCVNVCICCLCVCIHSSACHSTETAMFRIVNDLLTAMDSNKIYMHSDALRSLCSL